MGLSPVLPNFNSVEYLDGMEVQAWTPAGWVTWAKVDEKITDAQPCVTVFLTTPKAAAAAAASASSAVSSATSAGPSTISSSTTTASSSGPRLGVTSHTF